MVVRRIGAALAIAAMTIPMAGQAAMTAIGTVSSGSGAFVARNGAVIPATAGMRLHAGDRVITRAGGNANVQMANSCATAIGASSMLPVTATTCSKPSTIGFDEGRAGYAGRSSAFRQSGGHLALGAALAAIFIAGAYFLVRGHHHHHGSPASP